MSKRQSIINAIKVRLATITSLSGYNTEAGGRVYEWHTPIEEDDLPYINIKDTDDAIYIEAIGSWNHELDVSIEAYCTKLDDTPAELRRITEDVINAVWVDTSWSGLAEATEFVSDSADRKSIGFIIEQYNKVIAKVTLRMRILYRTGYGEI
jgi:hypothetical protein